VILPLGVFALTLYLVIFRPRGLSVAAGALIGAALALLLGLVGVSDVLAVWNDTWNATLTLVALIVLSLLLDAAGLFRFLALHLARRAGGHSGRLFALLVVFGALLAALFANDGAVLILTPIALSLCSVLGFSRAASLRLLFAVGFIADAASLPLITSNLTNIISADLFGLPFARYATVMGPVNLVGVVVSLGVLWLLFRRAWPARYDLAALPPPGSALLAPRTCWAGAGLMAALLAGFFLAPGVGVPVSGVALLAAAVLLAVSASERRVALGPVLRSAPWDVVLFSLGMYLVVYGVKNAGLTVWLAGLLEGFAAHGAAATVFGTGGVIAALSAITNNLPAVLIGTLSIQEVDGVSPALRELMVYANIVAADIGPKLTPIGSLATLLWLGLLRKQGVKVSWGKYLKLGLIATPPVLIAALVALWWRLGG
jgi:arsenical pump membrane protein